jgi:hypothetical protein
MLETMRTEKVRVQLAITHIDEAEVEPLSCIHDTYTMPISEFHQLTAKVTNLSRKLRLFVSASRRLIPL